MVRHWTIITCLSNPARSGNSAPSVHIHERQRVKRYRVWPRKKQNWRSVIRRRQLTQQNYTGGEIKIFNILNRWKMFLFIDWLTWLMYQLSHIITIRSCVITPTLNVFSSESLTAECTLRDDIMCTIGVGGIHIAARFQILCVSHSECTFFPY